MPHSVDFKLSLSYVGYHFYNIFQLAAKRLVQYWTKRLDIFGSECAFLPLTQDGALKDDQVALGIGFLKLLPAKDVSGRSIMFADPSKLDKSKYERKSLVRSVWYVCHAALEDEETQKKGMIFISFPRHAKLTNFDRELVQMNIDSIKGCLPIRLSAMHVCYPPVFFRLIFPIMKILMGERLRKRIVVHGGSEEYVLKTLSKFSLTKDHLPVDLGGNIGPFYEDWLTSRRAMSK